MDQYVRDYKADEIVTHTVDNKYDCGNFFKEKDLNFKLLHVNIRSVRKNLDELRIYLSDIKVDFHCIVLSECWNIDDTSVHNIPGYSILYNNSRLNQNDGVVVYIEDSLNYKSKIVLINIIQGLEIELKFGDKNILLTALYRLPSTDSQEFIVGLSSYLEHSRKNYDVHLFLGDININILKDDATTHEYLSTLSGEGFISAVNKPTRIQGSTKTCIDHLFVNCRSEYFKCVPVVIYDAPITDHFLLQDKLFLIKNQLMTNIRKT